MSSRAAQPSARCQHSPARHAWALALVASCLGGGPVTQAAAASVSTAPTCPPSDAVAMARFLPCSDCAGCHPDAFEAHVGSQHADAGTNPAFVAELDALRTGDAADREVARTCLRCHSPTLAAAGPPFSLSREPDASLSLPGVTCDFCHSITGFDGDVPGGGNATTCPGDAKRATLPGDDTWHRQASPFHATSELCAICHSWTNVRGVAVRSTYAEWQNSPAAAAGVQCQDCHMSLVGFQVDGRSYFAAGRAATPVNARPSPERAKLHLHGFPGAGSRAQVRAAVDLELQPGPPCADGDRSVIVLVSNVGAGHSVPTGSTESRLLWLEVDAGGRSLDAAPADPARPFDVAGAPREETGALGPEVPAGSRVYRAVLVDDTGAVAPVHRATGLLFDNRLKAGESRREPIRLPEDIPPGAPVRARLRWLPPGRGPRGQEAGGGDAAWTVAEAVAPAPERCGGRRDAP